MKKTLITTTLTAALTLTLTACSTPEAETDTESASSPAPAPSETTPSMEPIQEPTPDHEISERGSIVLDPGESGYVIDENDNELVTFTVNSIEVDPECTGEWAEEPENGVFVMFDAQIESELAAGDHYIDPGLFFNPYSYRAIDPEGVTRSESASTVASSSCLPESEQIPTNLGPGEKASGKVVFDVPTETGTMLLGLDASRNLQWEWNY